MKKKINQCMYILYFYTTMTHISIWHSSKKLADKVFIKSIYLVKCMSAQAVTENQVYSALRKCMDPEIPVNVVDLGLVYGVYVNPKNNVDIKMTMTTRGCPLHDTLVSDVKRYVSKINGIGNINVEIVWDPPWSIEKMDPVAREKLGFSKPKSSIPNRL